MPEKKIDEERVAKMQDEVDEVIPNRGSPSPRVVQGETQTDRGADLARASIQQHLSNVPKIVERLIV
jgi:hypothetical protein